VWRAWGDKMYITFWLESLKEKDHSEDLIVDGSTVLKYMVKEISVGDVNCTHLAQGKGQ
jgi:hypothetical protein